MNEKRKLWAELAIILKSRDYLIILKITNNFIWFKNMLKGQESEEETKRELLPPAPDSSAPLHTPAPPNPNEQSNLHAQMLGRLFYGKDVERKVICDWNDFGEPLSECSHAMRRHSVRRPFPTAKDESEKSEVSEALGGAPRTSKLRESMKMLQNPVPPTVTDPFSLSSKQR